MQGEPEKRSGGHILGGALRHFYGAVRCGPVADHMTPLIPDGIWLGLDHQRYIADPALGSGDLKELLVSPVQFHGRRRNPVWRQILGEDTRAGRLKTATAQEFGTAFHCIALEPEVFEARYCVAEPQPDLPDTKDEIAHELVKRGVTPPRLSAKSIMFEAEARLHGIKTLKDWKTEQAMIKGERIGISDAWFASLKMMRKVMERHSQAMNFLSKGRAEVSVFWSDEYGHRYKVRFDYLRVRTCADLKTYALVDGLGAVESFNRARRKFNYALSAGHYMNCRTEVMPDLIEKGRIFVGNPELDDDGDVTAVPAGEADRKFFADVAAWKEPRWWWVAASTGGVPEIDTIELDKSLTSYSAALYQVEQAKQNYRDFRAKFGDDDNEMWMEDRGLIAVTDDHFSRDELNRGSILHEILNG